MKIALIGPGLMPIPPQGWGAVEMLIWKYYQALQVEGHEVTIFNSQNLSEVVTTINKNDFDFVHVHYDEFAHFFAKYCQKPFCITSHYGYILKKERWAKGYFSIFADFLKAPGIIALSPAIQKIYLDAGYKGAHYVLKNGIDVSSFAFKQKGNGKVLCLGKIEVRKQQALLANSLEGKIMIDFVGPIVDEKFVSGETCRYEGIWTTEEVRQQLTNYSVLVLISNGEAAPLVVIEALAAGLSVVISQSASANLDQKDFITLLPDNMVDSEFLTRILNEAVHKNDSYRNSIRAYALATFDNSICMSEYMAIIKNFSEKKVSIQSNKSYIKENYFQYYSSRVWVWLSKFTFLRKLKSIAR